MNRRVFALVLGSILNYGFAFSSSTSFTSDGIVPSLPQDSSSTNLVRNPLDIESYYNQILSIFSALGQSITPKKQAQARTLAERVASGELSIEAICTFLAGGQIAADQIDEESTIRAPRNRSSGIIQINSF